MHTCLCPHLSEGCVLPALTGWPRVASLLGLTPFLWVTSRHVWRQQVSSLFRPSSLLVHWLPQVWSDSCTCTNISICWDMCSHKTHINVALTWKSSQSTQVRYHRKTCIIKFFQFLVLTWYFSTHASDSPTANSPLKLLCLGLSSRSGLTLSRENSSCQSPFTHWSPIVENERFISLLSEDTCCTCAKHKNTQNTQNTHTNPKSTHASTNAQTQTQKTKQSHVMV